MLSDETKPGTIGRIEFKDDNFVIRFSTLVEKKSQSAGEDHVRVKERRMASMTSNTDMNSISRTWTVPGVSTFFNFSAPS